MPKIQFRFARLIIEPQKQIFENLKYFPQVAKLYFKYLKFLEDDFSDFHQKPIEALIKYIENSAFYLVLNKGNLCGFFILEKFIGNKEKLHSAEVTICFNQGYWGNFTKLASQVFKEFCFKTLKLHKIKAYIYPQNINVRQILKTCGFKKEATLKSETVKNGIAQDLELYSIIKE